jgi:replicative DNA helicase
MATIDENLRRVPPQSLEAEESVLGGIMLDNAALDRVVELVQPEDFYRGAHKKLFRAMLELSERSEPVDLITLSERLKARGELAEIGGDSYLAELTERVPTAANVVYHARIVRERSILRGLIEAATEIATRGYQSADRVDELLDRAEQLIFGIQERKVRPAFARIAEILVGSIKTIERLYEQKQAVTGVPTGFADLDNLTSGFQASDLIIVAGRPSMGKTAIVLNIAEHAALRSDTGVAIFSLEMSKEQLAMRMLCSEARVDLARVRTGHLSDREFPKLAMAAGRLADAPIYIDDTPALSVLELRAKARRLKRDGAAKLGLVIVDYIQLMRSSEGRDNREQEISEISRSLKALAKELQLPVVALSQLNRQVENRNPPIPRLADLRECVSGDTLVVLADGRRVPIAQLVGAKPRVLALSRVGGIVEAVSDKVWRVGRRPVFRVTLASGRAIKTTARHRLLSGDGWERVEDLAVGDRLAAARWVPNGGTSQSRSTRSLAPAVLAFENPAMLMDAESDVSWDRIVAIEPAGEMDVFDLTVPEHESWLADGIVSHNSGAIEQDADVICFLYREEYYSEDTDKKGIAEVIVAKQRNGPIGNVELTFLKEFTRFENREVGPEDGVAGGSGPALH